MAERISVLGAALHLGRNMGGTTATIEGAHSEAVLRGKPAYILSPQPDEVISRAEKMGVQASKVTTTRGTVLVRIAAPPPRDPNRKAER